MKRSWILTAFEPFAGRPQNNSQLVLEEIRKLVDEKKSDPSWSYDFHYRVLRTEYDACFAQLMGECEALEKSGVRIEGILSLGEGAEDFKLETQANNYDDVPGFPDNLGVVRIEQKIFPKLKSEVIPLRFPFEAFGRIRSSNSPGFFVCNNLCAHMGQEFAALNKPYFGFIHVPRTGQGGVFTPDVCAAMIVNGFKKF